MARNRKRAKERRARRPQGAPVTSNGRSENTPPDPIEHSAPDVELAEAQLALGRPEKSIEDEDPEQAALDEAEFVREEDEADRIAGVLPARVGVERGDGGGASVGDAVAPAERRASAPNRLVHFLQGSWRELQRVQWPDRRQVMQATGVVIGFVIVAGVFLGVADLLASKLMNYILTGHFK